MAKNVIEVTGLTKIFETKIKQDGLKGSIRALFRPEYRNITAVDAIGFSVKEGELLALIGPNGAGKSTTIKMLTGILYPSDGEAHVLGFTPWKDRKKLAYNIGTVFGQKPQLWYHLPAIDTYNLFSKIYELDPAQYKKRVNRLIKLFEIEDIVHTPVRKLSLGQRMRCEIVASLLHKPKVLFLDEPSIGLDIIAKQKLRELIKKLNKEENMSIILTSHDMDDIEKICNRMIIINHGTIVYEGKVSDVKRDFVNTKIIDVLFEKKVSVKPKKGITILKKSTQGVKLQVDINKVHIRDALSHVGKNNVIQDITITDPPIEDIIARIYEDKQ